MILNARNSNVSYMLLSNGDQAERKKRDKEAARGMLQPRAFSEVRVCNNCGSQLEKVLQCPCHTVAYCDKACQVAHWKASHKAICPKFAKK